MMSTYIFKGESGVFCIDAETAHSATVQAYLDGKIEDMFKEGPIVSIPWNGNERPKLPL